VPLLLYLEGRDEEDPRTLRVRVDAHVIEMEYNSQSRINLIVDGELIKSKVRMI
jgi:hypothetical protein